MVWAGPEDQFEIAKLILGSSETVSANTELVPVGSLEAASVAVTSRACSPAPRPRTSRPTPPATP